MSKLEEFFKGASTLFGIAGDVTAINNWMQLDDEKAFANIEGLVQSSSPQNVELLDTALLMMATNHSDADARYRLIQFYVVFKMAETVQYGKFRGFP